MKLFTGWVLAAELVLVAAGAHAQVVAPVSDVGSPGVGGPYAAMPPDAPRPGYGYGPTLLPSTEVYTVVREAGLSPLGIPHLRSFVYTIAVIDRSGNDGRLFIDARNGRVIRFASARRMGDDFNDEPAVVYGAPGAPAPMSNLRAAPRPPRAVPHVASHTVPVPKAKPLAARSAPEQAQQTPAQPQTPPPQQTAATTPKPSEVQASPPADITTGAAQAKPAPQIAPTQDMPNVQGLE